MTKAVFNEKEGPDEGGSTLSGYKFSLTVIKSADNLLFNHVFGWRQMFLVYVHLYHQICFHVSIGRTVLYNSYGDDAAMINGDRYSTKKFLSSTKVQIVEKVV